MSNNEAEWLLAAQNGSEEAFATMIDMYQTPVYNLCYRMLGNAEDAEDAAQETFWRAYQAINRYDANRSFITWLLSIAAHYCIDQQRRRRLPVLDLDVLPEEDVPDVAVSPEAEFGQLENSREVEKMLSKLNPQDRAAIVLRYWYDFSEEEISKSLSISVSAVKSRLFRARRQLAEIWQVA
ncbi:MAG: sigma-70 family RNA polymerase sigma factor [Anaerolineae bacterium]|nr:sigma-70 family RNA polymerase sigma factor [Anaerolineae bacterium]